MFRIFLILFVVFTFYSCGSSGSDFYLPTIMKPEIQPRKPNQRKPPESYQPTRILNLPNPDTLKVEWPGL